jgi:uncharacterized membrane protein YqjE
MTTRHDEPGLLDALSRLTGHLFGMVQSRLELASLELNEARAQLVLMLIASFAAVLLFGGAVAALSAWVAVVLWPTLGHTVLGWIALAYMLAGGGVVWWLRARLRNDPPLLADTLAELRHDAAFMRGENDDRGNRGDRGGHDDRPR